MSERSKLNEAPDLPPLLDNAFQISQKVKLARSLKVAVPVDMTKIAEAYDSYAKKCVDAFGTAEGQMSKKYCKATTQSDGGIEVCYGKQGHRGMHWYAYETKTELVRVSWKKKRQRRGRARDKEKP